MRRKNEIQDIAPGLVDLLFALLGVALLILAAFTLRAVKASPHVSTLKMSVRVLARHMDSGSSSDPFPFPVYGCLTVRTEKAGTIYASASGGWKNVDEQCGETERMPEGMPPTHWYWLARAVWLQRSLAIPIEVSSGETVAISLRPMDLTIIPFAGASFTRIRGGLWGERYALLHGEIQDPVSLTVMTETIISNLPTRLSIFVNSDDRTITEVIYDLSVTCALAWLNSTGIARPTESELEWRLKVDRFGGFRVVEKPNCAQVVSR